VDAFAYQPSAPAGAPDDAHFMTPALVRRLEDALSRVGAFGQVRLIVQKGQVRFIEIVRSESLDRNPISHEQLR
jgi:hypothetical protein